MKPWPTTREFNALSKPLIEQHDCGPFDGGCLAIARALQQHLGGQVCVMINDQDLAEHAVLRLGNLIVDASGGREAAPALERFTREELAWAGRAPVVAVREIREDDLPDAPDDIPLIQALAATLPNDLADRLRVAEPTRKIKKRGPN